MRRSWTGWMLLAVALGATASSGLALPDPSSPVDPAKRAPVSTEDAVRPGAMAMPETGMVGARFIRMSEIPIRRAALRGDGVGYQVRESKPKVVRNYSTEKPEVRTGMAMRKAVDMPASIPRISRDRFQKMIAEYEKGRVPADEYLRSSIEVGGSQVSVADINKYANPGRALEDQGIPIRRAGSADAGGGGPAVVPIPEHKR